MSGWMAGQSGIGTLRSSMLSPVISKGGGSGKEWLAAGEEAVGPRPVSLGGDGGLEFSVMTSGWFVSILAPLALSLAVSELGKVDRTFIWLRADTKD